MDGIELRGSARVVEYGAGTCNVSEERETAASYEQKKANHGQPVDVWQLDFSVYNGSGRPLDHLIANYRVASENPPCTNWSWPDAGRYPGPIEWGDLAGFIQRSGSGNPTPPGETLTDTKYVFAFHDHAPRFDTWSVDYNFAATAPAAAETPPAGAEAPLRDASPRPAPTPDPPILTYELCTGRAPGASCWMELANEAGCYLWNPSLQARETVTWTGRCSAGYAQGLGQVRWLADGSTQTEEGRLVDGQRDGIWVTQDQDGWASQGSHARGQRHGTSVWCRFGRPRNVSQVAIYEYGILLRSYASYHEIDDERLADEAARICARLLPSGQLSHPGLTNASDLGQEGGRR